MKKVLFFLGIIFCYSDAMAKCTYDGSSKLLTLSISPKIATDPSIPVGSVLFSKKFGTGHYKTFSCSKVLGDQYIISSTAPEVPGVTGLQGKPVYATGIDGIGFQVSDILASKNGSVKPAVVGSTIVPIEKSNNDYEFITIWLIKTKSVIDISGTSADASINFSVGNLVTNPKPAERTLVNANVKISNITFKDSSCDISVAGSSQVTLNRIEKNTLLSVSRGGITPAQKTITMNILCPANAMGNKVTYWFNPITGTSAYGDSIIDNMLTGANAASNVGIIFKKDNKPIVFYDMDKYYINNVTTSQSFAFTADYYRSSSNINEITTGNVKAILEVVIQEE